MSTGSGMAVGWFRVLRHLILEFWQGMSIWIKAEHLHGCDTGGAQCKHFALAVDVALLSLLTALLQVLIFAVPEGHALHSIACMKLN